jgi:hypothetical protein
MLEDKDKRLVQLSRGFVNGRFQSLQWVWVDSIDMGSWAYSQRGLLLAYLPFIPETWKRAGELLGEYESEYWVKTPVYPGQVDKDMDFAIDKLVKYGRPTAALECLYMVFHDKKQLDKPRAVQALLSVISVNEPLSSMDIYYVTEFIKALQNDPTTNPSDLFQIEWAYLPLLDGFHGASPKLLENRLASDPSFFCEVIRSVYRPRGTPKSDNEPSEKQKAIATNAYKLLHEWRTPPGVQADGSLSADCLKDWLKSVKKECSKSGHLEVALAHIGKVLIFSPPDTDGLWINHVAAEALNAKDSEEMRSGFELGIFNSRGAHWVDPTGKPELELAAKYDKQAEDVENVGYQRLAISLRNLVNSYKNEARRIIEEHEQEQNDDKPLT